jgi:hypothetical protein
VAKNSHMAVLVAKNSHMIVLMAKNLPSFTEREKL